MFLSPERSPKQPLPGIGLHDPLHDRQACPKLNSFNQGVGQISLRGGLLSCRPLPKHGQICYNPAPPIVERLVPQIDKRKRYDTLKHPRCVGYTNEKNLKDVFSFRNYE